MAKHKLTDAEAKAILLDWPASTEKLWPPPQGSGGWIRGQPVDGNNAGPRIGSPGAKLFSTQPDGLFIYFSGIESCDLVAIEVCGTVQNLNDKRSRYIPSSHSLILRCSSNWLREEIPARGREAYKQRWILCKTIKEEPAEDYRIPIRHMRVLYALPNHIYATWCPGHVPTGYEYFCPHSALDSYNSQKMQDFLRKMSLGSQFYLKR